VHGAGRDQLESKRNSIIGDWRQIRADGTTADRNVQDRLLRLTVRFIDGKVSADSYKRARRKLVEEPDAPAGSSLGPAVTREELARAARLAKEWPLAVKMEDTQRQRVVLGELIDGVVPVRRSMGGYEARISWSALARECLEVGVFEGSQTPPR
jgi:hypothetical protein